MLIVNADDWGGHAGATDPILRCFEAGAITSTTAMVHMADSERAAELARKHDLPVGLHLNLTQAFDDPATPAAERARQGRIAAQLGGGRRRGGDVRLFGAVRASVREQLNAFRDAYGCEPTHVDGHNHVHLRPVVLAALPAGLRLRTAAMNPGALRALRRTALAWRFRTPAAFYALPQIHPELGGQGLDEVLARAEREDVEVMCHPALPDEERVLLSAGWRAALSGRALGSFADLR